MKGTLKKVVNSTAFNTGILVLIFANSILIGLQTTSIFASTPILQVADTIFLYVFSIEIVLKIFVNGKFFFFDKWNIFDMIIIICSLVFSMSTLMVFRAFRAFRFLKTARLLRYVRIMRFFPNSENLQKIITSISRAIPKILSTGFLLVLIFYVYAVLGVSLYGTPQNTVCAEFFGNIVVSLQSLFQVMTGDSWASEIARSVRVFHPSVWVYLISFYTITALTLLSVVTGVIVDSISNVSKEFEKGDARYTQENHIIILGFNEIALFVLEEINSYEKDSNKLTKQRVLVLDNGDFDKNRLQVAEKLGAENCLHVEFFTGEIADKQSLEKCNVAHAKSILLLDDDETKTAKIILSIRSLWEEKLHGEVVPPYFVAVVKTETHCQTLRRAFPAQHNEHIHLLSGEKIISNILAHACRKYGFSEIFKELLTSEKNEIYAKDFPVELHEKPFYEAALCYPTATLIGFIDSDGKVFLNPQDKEQKIGKKYKGVFLSEREDTIKCSKKSVVTTQNKFESLLPQEITFDAKHILFVGCNKYLRNILVELDNYVGRNSTAVIVANAEERKIFHSEIESLSTKNFTCTFNDGVDLQNFSNIPSNIQVIVFLSNSLSQSNEADSEVLVNLLTLISSLEESDRPKYRLLCEMRKIENQSIAPKKQEGTLLNGLEYVVGNRVTSQILAQIALNESLHSIYEELLSFAGSEMYMRSLRDYGLENESLSVYAITQKALAFNEIFIGYTTANGEVVLNPAKNEKNLRIGNLIVLSALQKA